MGNPSPRYTAEFKQKAVEPCGKSGTTYAEVARGLGCDAGSLADWAEKAGAAGPAPDANPFQMAEGLRRPKRESERLKREDEMLSKASALFAGRQPQGPRRRGPSSSPHPSTRRAGRRRAEDGPGQAKQPEGLRASLGSRIPQYVSLLLSKTMRENGIRPSMGSISSPWDNAAMESLMGIVRSECVHARAYATREEAALDLSGYIEVVYNRTRTRSTPGCLSPAEFEKANWPAEDSRSKAA